MASYTNAYSGTWNTADDWNAITNIDTFFTAGTYISSAAKYSATWTGNTGNTYYRNIGFLYSLTDFTTPETLTFTLQEDNGGGFVDTTAVSTLTVDSTLMLSLSGTYGLDVCRATWNNGQGYAENASYSYRIKFVGSSAGTSTKIAYATGQSSQPAKMNVYLPNQTYGVIPTSTDTVYICGISSNGSISNGTVTVTNDDTATTRCANIHIGKHGILTSDNTSSNTGIKLGGPINVYNKGTFAVDATKSATYTHTLNLYSNIFCNEGGSVSIQGYPKFGATPTDFRTTLSSTANSSQAHLITSKDMSAIWSNGDKLTVATTSSTSGKSELLTIQSMSGTNITCTGNCVNQHLSGAEVCNITRNLKVLCQTTVDQPIEQRHNTRTTTGKNYSAIFDIDYVEFNARANSGIVKNNATNNAGTSDSVFNVDNCSFYNTGSAITGYFLNTYNSSHSNLVAWCNSTLYGLCLYDAGSYTGSFSLYNSSIILPKSGDYNLNANAMTIEPVYLEGVNVYDGTSIMVNVGNAPFILNKCKIFGGTGTGIQTGNCIGLKIYNSYIGSDGTNNISTNKIDKNGTNSNSIYTYNCYFYPVACFTFPTSTTVNDSFGKSIASNYDKWAFNNSNYQMTADRHLSYQYYGTISDPTTAGYTTAYSKGGSGNCVVIKPTSTTLPTYWSFQIPGTISVAEVLSMYITKTGTFNGAIKITIRDLVYNTLLAKTTVTDANIPVNDGVGSDWTYQWNSGNITPTVSGNCTVTIEVTGTAGAVLIDDITVV